MALWNFNDDDYSRKELALIKHYGFEDLIPSVPPVSLYRVIIEHAFIRGEENAFQYSLRRVARALQQCRPYRMTPEFDALIDD